MLSNSNVFILLILINYSTLFQITLANSVALNAHAQFDGTNITTADTVTSTTSLSYVSHFHDNNSDNGEDDDDGVVSSRSNSSSSISTTPRTRHHIMVNIKTSTTKDPLVTGNRQQFFDIIKDSKTARTITNQAAPTTSTIDHAIKSNKIPFLQVNASSTKTARNVSSKFEMVPSSVHAKKTNNHQIEKPIPDTKSPFLSSSKSIPSNNNRTNQEINSQQSRSPNVQNSTLMAKSNNNSNNQIIDDNDNIKSLDYVNGNSIGDKDDYVNSDIQLPQSDAPASTGSNTTASDHVSDKVRPDAVYFVVAVIGGAKIWARTLAQMLDEMGPPFNADPLGSPIRPLFVDLPTNGRFSVNVLLSLCQQSEKRPLAGVVVIGNGQSAHAVAYAGSAMQLPVLWAKGGTTDLRELHPEASLQALLQPSAIEIFEAVRSLFLQTHWHSFFVLSDVQATNVMNVKDNPLRRPPLIPTVVPLPRNNDDVFKQLAQISRSTRGIILLLSNLQATRRVMSEAHRLNMVGGHFIWLWIDTSTSTGYFHQANVPQQPILKHQSKPQHSLREGNNGNSSSNNSSTNAGYSTEHRKSSNKANNVTTSTQKYDGNFDDAKGGNKSPFGTSGKKGSSVNNSSSSRKRLSNEDQSTKSNVDFSQGFDPFLVLQRQDEHLKQTFGLTQHYQDRTAAQRDNKQTPANRLILGLRDGDGGGATETTTNDQTTVRSKKTRRSKSQTNFDDPHYDDDEFDADINDKTSDNTNNSAGNNFLPNAMPKQKPISSKYRNFSDDNLDDFIDNNNFNEYHNNIKWNFKRTSSGNATSSSSYVNFHQFKDFPVGLLALRPIRMNVDRHFIRAAVRVFAATWMKINSSNTVVKLTPPPPLSTQQHKPTLSTQSRQKNRNAQTTTVLYNAKKFGNDMQSRKIRRKRNIHTVDKLLTMAMESRAITIAATATTMTTTTGNVQNETHSELSDDVEQFEQFEHETVPHATMQVNSSLFLKEFSNKNKNFSAIDKNQRLPSQSHTDGIEQSLTFNRSFTSDLPIHKNTNNTYYINNNNINISLTQLNVSFNRNFSGLWKQNSKTKSNIHSLNELRQQQQPDTVSMFSDDGHVLVTPSFPKSPLSTASISSLKLLSNVTNQSTTQLNHNDRQIESMAKQASQSVVANFFDIRSQDIRPPLNKRQNAWWSTKKEMPPSATKRPQYDANTNSKHTNQLANVQHNSNLGSSSSSSSSSSSRSSITNVHDSKNPIKSETPSYFGGCYGTATPTDIKNAEYFARALRDASKLALSGKQIYHGMTETALTTSFELLNLVPNEHPYLSKPNDDQATSTKSTSNHKAKRSTPSSNGKGANVITTTKWRRVGMVSASSVRLDTIVWPGGDIVVSGLSAGARTVFRIVTALAPPFVMESELDEDGLCLRGLPCHRVSPVGRHNLTLMFNAIETRDRLEEDAVEHGNDLPPEPEQLDEKISHVTKCCYGLTMDLLDNIATELSFEFHLYVVRDQLFGSKQQRDIKDYIKSHTHHSSSDNGNSSGSGNRSNSSGNTSKQPTTSSDHDANDETSSTEQWSGIIGDLASGSADMSFAPLSVSKARAQVIDFSIPYFHSGVSLLASPKTKSEIPLLAFLLPFSPELWIAIFTSLNITAVAVAVYEWLSPFGLNPWGRQRSKNFSLSSALWVMWGLLCGHLVAFKAPKSWPNKFLINVWGGFSVIFVASYTANIAALIAGLFFHHAANSYDSSLTTQRVGAPIASAAESYVQNKDKHLWEHMKKYSLNHIEDGIRGLKNGTLDLLMADSPILDYYRATDHGCSLQRIGETFVEDTYAIGMVKGFPLKESISALIAKYSSNGYLDILTEKWYGGLPCFKYESEIVTPRPLGVAAVAGVFLLLGLGMVMGVVILIFEHWFYKYALPSLRLKPKGTIWKSRNIMFFSQKLYRFINCVELVSPHHAARELVHSIRQGQIASLFQKSIKRKEDEQRRRRKSKAQFFEMIQEIRRAQQVERQTLAAVAEAECDNVKSPPVFKPRASPKPGIFSALKKDGRSRSNSSVLTPRRFSTDSILGDRLDSIGRRLSRDLTNSPPDMNKRYEFVRDDLSPNRYGTVSGANLAALGISKSNEALSNRYDTFSGKNVDKASIPVKLKKTGKRPKISFESYHRDRSDSGDRSDCGEYELPSVKEGLEPPIQQQDKTVAILRHKLHSELRSKHPPIQPKPTVTIVETVPNSKHVDRPPLPKKVIKHQRQKSLDNLDVQNDSTNRLKTSPYKSDSSASSITSKGNQRSQMSLERLSREDLLRLSHSSQSEIHEYLKGTSSAEPP